MTRLRRCPACRLAGREGPPPLITGAAARPGETIGVRVTCPQCLCTGPNSPTVDDAVDEWNAIARAAKRGMRAKGGRTAAVLEAAHDLVGKPVYIEWRVSLSGWHWFDLLSVDGDHLRLRGLASPDGMPWRGGGAGWREPARGVKSIRALRDDEQ